MTVSLRPEERPSWRKFSDEWALTESLLLVRKQFPTGLWANTHQK